ncbi:MAG: hypothetical protein OES09_00070 [Gammaproteobacteria bacterium]|nr:hypothetical protein [Gammaproteobacteria bacterium]
MITNYATRESGPTWPAVRIIKGLPGHPLGAIRNPRPELRDRWLKMGICEVVKKRGRPKKKADAAV